MSRICFGCGAKLQSNDENKKGYVLERRIDDAKYCMRCFKMIHYGKQVSASVPKSTDMIIKTVNENAKFVVFMTDFINIIDVVIETFKGIRVPKIFVVSKSDVIPKNVSFSQIKNYLRTIYDIEEEIIFTSNKNNLNTLTKRLHGLDEIYFLGLTNSGKSTILNSIIEKQGSKNALLTTSYKENTTQDFVRIRLDDGVTLVDSPGFVIDNFEVDKLTNIDAEIKPLTYQNKVDCTYKIGDIVDVTIENRTNVVFYFSKNILIKRLYSKPVDGTSFKVKGNSDIVICGLGFIKITQDAIIILPSDLMKYVHIRPSLVGGVYE